MPQNLAHGSFERLLPLDRGFNFRDFGGYPTRCGQRVKRRKLFRSGTMSLLSVTDIERIRTIGIRAICDFRRQSEREAHPTRWHEADGIVYWSRDYEETTGLLASQLYHPESGAKQVRETMMAMYRDIVIDHSPAYAEMFRLLADGNLPLLINCTAGKDRTGVGAALILAALGVNKEFILEDYIATNAYADWAMLFASDNGLLQGQIHRDADANAQIMLADPYYIEETFNWIEAELGGVQSYLSNLGIGDDAVAEIRRALIEQ